MLHVLVVFDIGIDRIANQISSFLAEFLRPSMVFLDWSLGSLVLRVPLAIYRVRQKYAPYMHPRTQVRATNSIFVEALPLFKRMDRPLMVLLRVPDQHIGVKIQADGLAVGPDDPGGIVKQIVGVYDADLDAATFLAIGGLAVVLASDLGADLAGGAEPVEHTSELVVAGLVGQEIVEARYFVKGRDHAAVVGRHAFARMADEEGEVELPEDCFWDDCGVIGFWLGIVRVGSPRGAGSILVVGFPVSRPRSANAAFDPE